MSDFEIEKRLHELRGRAWDAFMKAYSVTGDAGQIFAAAAEVYDQELRVHLDADDATDKDYADDLRSLTRARTNVQQMIDAATFGTAEHYGLQMILADLNAVLGPDLLREADPTGEVLTELPFEQRKAAFDALEVGSPEHDAFCMEETAKMAAEDVARGEGQ